MKAKELGTPPAGTLCADCNFHGNKIPAVAYGNRVPLCAACVAAVLPGNVAVLPEKRDVPPRRRLQPGAETCPACKRSKLVCSCRCPRCSHARHRGSCKGEDRKRGIRGAGAASAAKLPVEVRVTVKRVVRPAAVASVLQLLLHRCLQECAFLDDGGLEKAIEAALGGQA
jgi:hypothetical protein